MICASRSRYERCSARQLFTRSLEKCSILSLNPLCTPETQTRFVEGTDLLAADRECISSRIGPVRSSCRRVYPYYRLNN